MIFRLVGQRLLYCFLFYFRGLEMCFFFSTYWFKHFVLGFLCHIYAGMWEVPPLTENPPHKITIFVSWPNKKIIFSCCHYSCTIFILTSYSFYKQVMFILVLIDDQYLENVVFRFTGEHPCRSVFSAWVFSCKFAAYFQNTFS